MDFLAGTLLWGAAAASLPVILHLTGRSKPVVHRFPALRFILASHRSASRALRIKHLLLLLLRMLAICALALALSRPLWPLSSPISGLTGRVRGEFVLIVDASMSMAFAERGVTCFERARRKATTLLSQLAPESRVALILATEKADAVQGRLTLHHEKVRHLLQHAKPTGRGLDLTRSLVAAHGIFDRDPKGELPRIVVLFTDLQRNAYDIYGKRGSGLDPGKREDLPALAIVDVGSRDAVNGGVLSVRLPGRTLPAEETVTLTARIRPVDPTRSCPVDLFIDGLKVAQRSIEPAGARSVDVEFSFPSGSPGSHSGKLVLSQSDGLGMDQERAMAYVAGRPPRALVIEQPGDPSRRGSAHFLRAALASASASSVSGLSITVEPSPMLTGAKLRKYQVVILADPGNLSEASWEALKNFVAGGGGLMAWAGPRTDPTTLRRHGYSDFERHRGLLPGRIGAWVKQPDKRPVEFRIARADHPVLGHLTADLRSALREVKVRQHLRVTLEPKDVNAVVVLKCTDGTPILLEKTYGHGRVFFWTIGPEPSSSDLPRYHGEVFLTLALDACRLLSGKAEEVDVRLGRPLPLTIPDPPSDGTVHWLQPGLKEEVTLRTERDVPAAANEAPVHVPGELGRTGALSVPYVTRPGIHRFRWKSGRGDLVRSLYVAANPETSESDLSRVEPKDAVRLLKPWKAKVVKSVNQVHGVKSRAGVGRELPVLMLISVLIVLVLESFLSNRLYRSTSDAVAEEEAKGSED